MSWAGPLASLPSALARTVGGGRPHARPGRKDRRSPLHGLLWGCFASEGSSECLLAISKHQPEVLYSSVPTGIASLTFSASMTETVEERCFRFSHKAGGILNSVGSFASNGPCQVAVNHSCPHFMEEETGSELEVVLERPPDG